MVVRVYRSLVTWDLLSQDLAELARMRSDLGDRVSPIKALPDQHKETLANFVLIGKQLQEKPLWGLRASIAVSKPLQHTTSVRRIETMDRQHSISQSVRMSKYLQF